jgi:hypothetical protein
MWEDRTNYGATKSVRFGLIASSSSPHLPAYWLSTEKSEHVRIELLVETARSKPGASVQNSGVAFAAAGGQRKKSKCREFGIT